MSVHWPAPRSKYAAQPVTIDGRRFASKREAHRYGELLLRQKAGEIRDLTCQPRFPLLAPVVRVRVTDAAALACRLPCVDDVQQVAVYVADFSYQEGDGPHWRLVVEDAKGVRTAVYRLKRRWFETQYGIPLREV